MKINFKKSSVMWFKASNRSTKFTYLPISISLSWSHHDTNVCHKINVILSIIIICLPPIDMLLTTA